MDSLLSHCNRPVESLRSPSRWKWRKSELLRLFNQVALLEWILGVRWTPILIIDWLRSLRSGAWSKLLTSYPFGVCCKYCPLAVYLANEVFSHLSWAGEVSYWHLEWIASFDGFVDLLSPQVVAKYFRFCAIIGEFQRRPFGRQWDVMQS